MFPLPLLEVIPNGLRNSRIRLTVNVIPPFFAYIHVTFLYTIYTFARKDCCDHLIGFPSNSKEKTYVNTYLQINL